MIGGMIRGMSGGTKCVLGTLAGLAVLGLVGAAAVVLLGLYNVSASVGHLPGVSWVLHTTYNNSVELRAPPESAVPELTDDMAEIGARHFETACRFCHAAPGERRWATARAMEPPPPPIREAVSDWEPRELFWIVLNGVKMSGMPHWPAPERRDEAWMMTAFLDRVRDMTEAQYAALVAPPEGADDPLVGYCASCHGLDGAGRGNAAMPRLDILGAPYIAASLAAYRDGLRHSGVMEQAAARLSEAQIGSLAQHFGRDAALADAGGAGGDTGGGAGARPARDEVIPPEAVAAGRLLALGHPEDTNTPSCRACHGPWPERRSALFPALAGQNISYVAAQLRLWRDGQRGGTARAQIMHTVAGVLDEDAIEALAAFYAAGAPPE